MDSSPQKSIDVWASAGNRTQVQQSSAAIAAYFEVEQVTAVRRTVWRFAALAALCVTLLSLATPVVNRIDWAFAAVLLGGGSIAIGVIELRARMKLDALASEVARR